MWRDQEWEDLVLVGEEGDIILRGIHEEDTMEGEDMGQEEAGDLEEAEEEGNSGEEDTGETERKENMITDPRERIGRTLMRADQEEGDLDLGLGILLIEDIEEEEKTTEEEKTIEEEKATTEEGKATAEEEKATAEEEEKEEKATEEEKATTEEERATAEEEEKEEKTIEGEKTIEATKKVKYNSNLIIHFQKGEEDLEEEEASEEVMKDSEEADHLVEEDTEDNNFKNILIPSF